MITTSVARTEHRSGLPDSHVAVSRRIVVLGASNVTFGFPLIASACLNSSSSGGTELHAAHGHGRSFCNRSFVLNRGLPPLPECRIWEELNSRPPVKESWALLTDVGNDLIYGLPPEEVADKVEGVIRQIGQLEMPFTYVAPPLERILKLTPWQYRITKKVLFPGRTVPWEILSERVVELDSIVTQLVQNAGGQVRRPRLEWYGIDPIHIRPQQRVAAWNEILEAWPFPEKPQTRWPGWNAAHRFWRLAPMERSYGKRSYVTSQPSLVRAEKGSIWLY